MGGYLQGTKLNGLSDLLTGRNKLHLTTNLCIVSNGCMKKRKRRKLSWDIEFAEVTKMEKETQVLFVNTFSKTV